MFDSEEKVIEPTEIIIEGIKTEPVSSTHVSPWTRFFARLFDYTLFNFVVILVLYLLIPTSELYKFRWFVSITYLVWIPFESFFLSNFGYTPGKALMNTKVRTHFDEKLHYKQSMKRSFSVWVKGVGFGIPIISIATMFFSFFRLNLKGITSWDLKGRYIVTHYPISPFRYILGVILIIALTIIQNYLFLSDGV